MVLSKGIISADQINTGAQLMAHIRQTSVELLALKAGHRALDLGCGTGMDAITMGHLVGPTGEVHGVDYDEAMVTRARVQAAVDGVSAWVTHHHASASALPWPNGFFDASRSERVFQHLLDPERAFDELTRVTKPGGQLVVIDGDWATLTIDSDETELERRLVQFNAAHMMNNPFSGRHLRRMFTTRGFTGLTIDVQPVILADVAAARQMMRLNAITREALATGVIDAGEAQRWEASLSRASESGAFFASVNMVLVSGRKPPRKASSRGNQALT